MGKFTKIPQDTFEQIQLDAGVILKTFTPDTPTEPEDEDIICPTTGGINVSCVPTYSDMGEDVDNCPTNMMELKHLDGWECTMSFTSLGTSPESIRLSLGAADVTGNKIVPRRDLKQTDFSDLWWVGDRADGGMVAVCLKNALSTGGFTLQTTKNGKGQVSVELMGHVSIDAQDTMPMEFYSAGPTISANVMEQGNIVLGKTVSDLISADTKIDGSGNVTGTLKHVDNFTDFSSIEEEQSGNYIPLKLTVTGQKMTLKKNGTASPDKTNIAFDPELIFRVSKQRDTFTVNVDGKDLFTLNFRNATLEDA